MTDAGGATAKPVVYIAGPYSHPDPCENTHWAVLVANALWDCVVPVVPHLTHFWHTMTPKPYEQWLEYDLALMQRCDAVFRMRGSSSGADAEVVKARAAGIPVFDDIGELRDWALVAWAPGSENRKRKCDG